MTRSFRVIDTGLREGRANIAFDQAMIDAHRQKTIPDTIRFLQFPPTALIGRHQDLSRELNLDHCRKNGIGIVRRITGGGAIYLDQGQLGWTLVFHRSTLGLAALTELSKAICTAAAAGLSRLGIDARYRPRNDIEVDGRKISGTGGLFDGDTILFQGTVLVDMNAQHMMAALDMPQSKLAKRALASGAQRVVTLRELLGEQTPSLAVIKSALLAGFAETLGIESTPGAILPVEEALAEQLFSEEIGSDEFVAEIDNPAEGNLAADALLCGTHSGAGGTVTSYVQLDGVNCDRVHTVLITGDFFVAPPRIILDLEAALKGVAIGEINATIEQFFRDASIDTLSVAPADFFHSIESALRINRSQTTGV